MKPVNAFVIVFLGAVTFSMTAQAQSGRRSDGPTTPAPPVQGPINKPTEPQTQNPLKTGSARVALPMIVDGERIYRSREVDTKAIVKKKPEPYYTREARDRRTKGKVVLRAIFSSNGEVTNISVISGLPNGLTESSFMAARLIKFEPAMKDGKPVSMWVHLEYQFWVS